MRGKDKYKKGFIKSLIDVFTDTEGRVSRDEELEIMSELDTDLENESHFLCTRDQASRRNWRKGK